MKSKGIQRIILCSLKARIQVCLIHVSPYSVYFSMVGKKCNAIKTNSTFPEPHWIAIAAREKMKSKGIQKLIFCSLKARIQVCLIHVSPYSVNISMVGKKCNAIKTHSTFPEAHWTAIAAARVSP